MSTDEPTKSTAELGLGEDAAGRIEYGTRSFKAVKARLDLDGGVNATIVYHDDCHDGITAAWVAKRAFPQAQLYAASYGKPVDLESFRGRDVVLVDFCWPYETMLTLFKGTAATLTVLDHHVSAKTGVLQPLLRHVHAARNYVTPLCIVYDAKRSGAGVAWDTLFPNEPRPHMINWVEDRDLWQFALTASRPFHAFSETLPLTIYSRDELFKQTQDPDQVKQLLASGRAIEQVNTLLVQDIARHAEIYSVRLPSEADPTKSEYYQVPVAVVPTTRLISEVGGLLALGYHFAITIVDVRPMFGTHGGDYDEVHVSFRSANRSDAADVSRIAAGLGGGGHRNAAGARMTSAELARRIYRTGRRAFAC